jgi:hypothetical protein
VSKGGVVIVCKDKDSTQKRSEELISKLGEDYEVSLPDSKGTFANKMTASKRERARK